MRESVMGVCNSRGTAAMGGGGVSDGESLLVGQRWGGSSVGWANNVGGQRWGGQR